MILGKIVGKCSTTQFDILVTGDAHKFDYCQVYHKDYDFVLCQIIELVKDSEKMVGKCIVLKSIDVPFEIGSEVLVAEDSLIESTLKMEVKHGAYIGKLKGKDIDIIIDLNELLTKHCAILAKTGMGKSYVAGVLVEEIIEKRVPLLIIDPHGEYSSMKNPGAKKGYLSHIQEYGDTKIDNSLRPLKLNENMSPRELMNLMKLSGSQEALLYSVVKDMEVINFDELIMNLQTLDSNVKWNLINALEYYKNLDIFSLDYTKYDDLIVSGKCSIINLKGVDPEVQQLIVAKMMSDLFSLRKIGKIPPFFCLVEEAHNFVPERSFGEMKSSKIFRTIASEGRKFGLGLCVISQRSARVDKNVLSQCGTQIILKVTNPNDLKAISNSVEGINSNVENEIQNLEVGTALVTGILDMPVLVNVRERYSKHGGEAVEVIPDFVEEIKEGGDILPLIFPNTTLDDLKIIHDVDFKTVLVPAMMFNCIVRNSSVNLLVNLNNGHLVVNDDTDLIIVNINKKSSDEIKLLETSLQLGSFSKGDLISKCGLNPLHAQDIFEKFIGNNYYIFENSHYVLGDKLKLIVNTLDFNFPREINYKSIKKDDELPKLVLVDVVENKLKRFLDIVDKKECFIVKYEMINKN